ncbi:hypothetical protein ABZT47_28790 [Sphaerisporangium sp. NPDC005289]|uniref:hypothetical protein n=1 Tax=Sphaerisporangium sp. NPDC005289 TaxID=3155247 RepID=UPI0033B72C10
MLITEAKMRDAACTATRAAAAKARSSSATRGTPTEDRASSDVNQSAWQALLIHRLTTEDAMPITTATLPALPEGLPDPRDRTQAWDGSEPAYLRWWQRLAEHAGEDDYPRVNNQVNQFKLRELYAHAIPTRAALERLLALGPLIEVGAGAGYWARLLRDLGGDVLAYDCYSPECNHWLTGAVPGRPAPVTPNWTAVAVANEGLVGQHPGRAVFVCWPPRPSNGYLINILRRHRPAVVALITQGMGPMRGRDDDFYLTLQEGWEQDHPQFLLHHWPYQTDNLTIWRAASPG